MTVFESQSIINKPLNEVYTFLADMNNHQKLMPGNIYNWSSTTDEARFTIQNMARLALKISERIENKSIHIIPAEEAPFEVELKWALTDTGNSTTQATLTISAELTTMMKMLVSGPLQNLTDHQVESLKSIP